MPCPSARSLCKKIHRYISLFNFHPRARIQAQGQIPRLWKNHLIKCIDRDEVQGAHPPRRGAHKEGKKEARYIFSLLLRPPLNCGKGELDKLMRVFSSEAQEDSLSRSRSGAGWERVWLKFSLAAGGAERGVGHPRSHSRREQLRTPNTFNIYSTHADTSCILGAAKSTCGARKLTGQSQISLRNFNSQNFLHFVVLEFIFEVMWENRFGVFLGVEPPNYSKTATCLFYKTRHSSFHMERHDFKRTCFPGAKFVNMYVCYVC